VVTARAGSAGPALRPCGSSSGAGACRAAVALAPQGGVSTRWHRTNADLKVGATFAWLRLEPGNLKTFPYPRRQNHDAVEKPQGWRASLALHFVLRVSPRAGAG